MKSFSRNFIIFYLMACVLGAFAFHWFFVGNMMSASECLSTNCAYSSTQTIVPPEALHNFLVALIAILFIAFLPLTIWLDNESRETPARIFPKWKIDGFSRKLISWLKILEKRDPETAFVAVRISDFSQ